MGNSKIKIAVIGCGAQGRNHLNAYVRDPEVEISAICDTDPARLEAAGKEFSVPNLFGNFADLIDAAKYDLVSVCTMPVSHREMVIASLERGANVICEKPMALNLDEALAMAAASRTSGKFLALGFNMRFIPAAQYLRRFVADGRLGQPICSSAWTLATDIPWWGKHYVKSISGGGVLASTAVHILDLATWVAGNPKPITASASMTRVFPRKRATTAPSGEAAAAFDVEDSFNGHIRFADGTWMSLSGGWSWDQPEYSYSFELVGDAAAVQFAPLRIMAERDGKPVDVTPPDYEVNPTGMIGWPASVRAEVRDAVEAVKENRLPLAKVEEALAVQAIIDAMYESAALGREVAVRDTAY